MIIVVKKHGNWKENQDIIPLRWENKAAFEIMKKVEQMRTQYKWMEKKKSLLEESEKKWSENNEDI